jgi:hypothetical protein
MPIIGSLAGRLENTIALMEDGDEGFTEPWALHFDRTPEGIDAYLNLNCTIYKKSEGQNNLHIKRIGPEKTDFEVDIETCPDHKWGLRKPCYYETDEEENIVCLGKVYL